MFLKRGARLAGAAASLRNCAPGWSVFRFSSKSRLLCGLAACGRFSEHPPKASESTKHSECSRHVPIHTRLVRGAFSEFCVRTESPFSVRGESGCSRVERSQVPAFRCLRFLKALRRVLKWWRLSVGWLDA